MGEASIFGRIRIETTADIGQRSLLKSKSYSTSVDSLRNSNHIQICSLFQLLAFVSWPFFTTAFPQGYGNSNFNQQHQSQRPQNVPGKNAVKQLPAGCRLEYRVVHSIVEKEETETKCTQKSRRVCTEKYQRICNPYQDNVCRKTYEKICNA